MRLAFTTLALCGVILVSAGEVRAQTVLTLPAALARAREVGPEIVTARLAVDEARGRLAGASLRFQTNPEIDFAAGNRRSPIGSSLDIDAGFTQRLEAAGRKSARMSGANAAVDRASASLDDTTRLVLRDVSMAFYRALHAKERIRLIRSTEDLAQNILQAADRRFRAGEIAVLDVNVARAALARAKAERLSAEAAYLAATSDLKVLLKLDADPDVTGSLTATNTVASARLLESARLRPDIRMLDAEIREAEADVQLGRTFGKPEFGVTMRYSREETANAVLGGVVLSLPTFSKGQELLAVGSARTTRLKNEREAAVRSSEIEVQTALAVHAKRVAALRELEQGALVGLDENDALAARSFEVGQIGLPDLLLLRREILDTRFQYLDAQLEAAIARVDIDFRAGVLR